MTVKRDGTFTYLEASEFVRLGERVYGFGWRKWFARQTGYTGAQIARYATGVEPIPPRMASLMRALAQLRDLGVVPNVPEAVGRIIEGQFEAPRARQLLFPEKEKRDRTLTYLDAGEFVRLGKRVYGFGWQQAFAAETGYHRVHIGRYATGVEPIPPHMASLMRALAQLLDLGVVPDVPKPVGRIVEGQFGAFTESTLRQLSEENAACALAPVDGADLSGPHGTSESRSVAERADRASPGVAFDARQRSVAKMAATAFATAAQANGQETARRVKNKEARFASAFEMEKYVAALVATQNGLCAVTKLPLQYLGEADDREMLASLDRIDSDGHYEEGNLQVVCRFVNRWKNQSDDSEFRRLIAAVRTA